MAIPVARVHLAMAHATLPGLLPTPPEWKTAPLLPTSSPSSRAPPPKPAGRADAAERWDARKNAAKAPSTPGCADAVERWDAHKVNPSLSTSSPSSSSSNSATTSHPAPPAPSQKWSSNKRAVSRAASDERWDARKQPRPVQDKALDDDDKSSTGSNDMSELNTRPHKQAFYAGSDFLVSPEPAMLPMPPFMVRVA